jgi:D-arabinose 1-dehydrogenase-like Zn-dependent alcohol dehydrogenase
LKHDPVLDIGGLGHLGIQFANKFGYKIAAIGRGSENAALAKKLGASTSSTAKRRTPQRYCKDWAARRLF